MRKRTALWAAYAAGLVLVVPVDNKFLELTGVTILTSAAIVQALKKTRSVFGG